MGRESAHRKVGANRGLNYGSVVGGGARAGKLTRRKGTRGAWKSAASGKALASLEKGTGKRRRFAPKEVRAPVGPLQEEPKAYRVLGLFVLFLFAFVFVCFCFWCFGFFFNFVLFFNELVRKR